jgi:PPOX class probable F420-dependent enzyme
MPKPPIPTDVDEFLRRPNPCVIATLRPDGHPHTAATWYLWEEGQVIVNMDERRRRLDYMRGDPRVSVTVMGAENWYHQVTLLGRVASLEPDPDYADIDRISCHYTGQPYSDHVRGRFTARIEVEAWYGWKTTRLWTD